MPKIAVKLAKPDNRFKDDDGVPFEPHVSRFVEHSERIKDAITIGLLERDRDSEAQTKVEPTKEKPETVDKPDEKIEAKPETKPETKK